MWTTSCLSPQTDPFPPFAKRSKEVTRYTEQNVLPVQPQYDQTFWGTDVPLPCEESFTFDQFLASALYFTPTGLVSSHRRASTGLTHEKLPHPSQLMGRKWKDHRLQKHTPKVLEHLGELRTKQRYINELKGDRWRGASAVASSGSEELPEAGDEQLFGPAAGVSISAETMAKPYEAASTPTPKLSFTGDEQFPDLTPVGNPMMAFVSGTAHRSLLMADEVMADEFSAAVNSGTSDGILRSNEDQMSLFY
ncbi:hypothetical protein Q8A67_003484 [Cirrhinus molitorella]|uniref:Uncharacterized protein n=1 Tax=Cirrhinus molitorella TaxID=172907 RepID=A0AA88QF63_9TELE|nr:hypothetical protein Q8A67_003484 [Cirrhinus molitorella]